MIVFAATVTDWFRYFSYIELSLLLYIYEHSLFYPHLCKAVLLLLASDVSVQHSAFTARDLTRPPKSLFRFNHSLNSPHVHRGVCLAARPVRQTTRLWCLAKAGKFKTSSLSKASKKTHDFHLLRVTAKKPLATVAAAQVDTFLIFFHVFFVPL